MRTSQPPPGQRSRHLLLPVTVGGEVIAVVQAVGSVRALLQPAEATPNCYHSSLIYSGLVLFGGRNVLADHCSNDPVAWNLTINVRTA